MESIDFKKTAANMAANPPKKVRLCIADFRVGTYYWTETKICEYSDYHGRKLAAHKQYFPANGKFSPKFFEVTDIDTGLNVISGRFAFAFQAMQAAKERLEYYRDKINQAVSHSLQQRAALKEIENPFKKAVK